MSNRAQRPTPSAPAHVLPALCAHLLLHSVPSLCSSLVMPQCRGALRTLCPARLHASCPPRLLTTVTVECSRSAHCHAERWSQCSAIARAAVGQAQVCKSIDSPHQLIKQRRRYRGSRFGCEAPRTHVHLCSTGSYAKKRHAMRIPRSLQHPGPAPMCVRRCHILPLLAVAVALSLAGPVATQAPSPRPRRWDWYELQGEAAAPPAPEAAPEAAPAPPAAPPAAQEAGPSVEPAPAPLPAPPLAESAASTASVPAGLSDGSGSAASPSCACTDDGVSGGVNTSAPGCGQWLADQGSNAWVCYIRVSLGEGQGCRCKGHLRASQGRGWAGEGSSAGPGAPRRTTPLLTRGAAGTAARVTVPSCLQRMRVSLLSVHLQEPALCYMGYSITVDRRFPGKAHTQLASLHPCIPSLVSPAALLACPSCPAAQRLHTVQGR